VVENERDAMSLTPEGNAKHQIRVTRLSVGPVDTSIFEEMTSHIEIDDEGAGEFIEVLQPSTMGGKIKIDVDEWPVLRDAIEWMIAECRTANETKGKT